MCRILGWAGKITSGAQHKKITTLLKALILSEERGNPHGTGLAVSSVLQGTQSSLLIKRGVRGSAFILQGFADYALKNNIINAVIGHVRFKTSGDQKDANSHPFGFRIRGEWAFGVHNGIIGSSSALSKKYGVKEHEVDSATFFYCLAKAASNESLEKAIEEVTYEISDTGDFAFALLYKGEIYLWRNEQRPLCIIDARGEGLGRFFCSTKEMLKKAMSLSGADVKASYFEALPYRLYKVGHKTAPAFEVEVVKELRRKEKPKLNYYLPAKYRVTHEHNIEEISDEEWENLRLFNYRNRRDWLW